MMRTARQSAWQQCVCSAVTLTLASLPALDPTSQATLLVNNLPTGSIRCGSFGGAISGRRFYGAFSCMESLDWGAMASPGPGARLVSVVGKPQMPQVLLCWRSSSGSTYSGHAPGQATVDVLLTNLHDRVPVLTVHVWPLVPLCYNFITTIH
eukprot:966526-Pelagomonas_calceolata.AAC.1